MAENIEWNDIQGNILNGYGMKHACYLMLHTATTQAARRCLAEVLSWVTTAARRPAGTDGPRTTVNVAITYAGFEQLGVRPDLLAAFPEAFREGPAMRAEKLGDTGPSHPDSWQDDLGAGLVHLLVTMYGRTKADLVEQRAMVKRRIDSDDDLSTVCELPAHALTGSREHFGYADGFAQPDIEGVDRLASAERRVGPGGGVPLADGGWGRLKLGEFVLGYADEEGQVARDPAPDLVSNGSYVVYRKLYQNVAAFRHALAQQAATTGLHAELVAAKIIGRWRDGVPLALSPERDIHDDLSKSAVSAPANDFRYLPFDRAGYLCPRGAHIRRANPRDALDFDGAVRDSGALSARHRIIRRSMPYGLPLPRGVEDDRDRGLVFVCYNADIERQFEAVQADWCNDGDVFGLGDDRDLIGPHDRIGKLTIPVPGSVPRFIDARDPFVVTRGAEYLFAPGIRGLQHLVTGTFG
jgi:Dyp-type peroxidase family